MPERINAIMLQSSFHRNSSVGVGVGVGVVDCERKTEKTPWQKPYVILTALDLCQLLDNSILSAVRR